MFPHKVIYLGNYYLNLRRQPITNLVELFLIKFTPQTKPTPQQLESVFTNGCLTFVGINFPSDTPKGSSHSKRERKIMVNEKKPTVVDEHLEHAAQVGLLRGSVRRDSAG